MRLTDRKGYICRRPRVWWYVHGRKQFGAFSARIRASWKVGTYPLEGRKQ